MATQPYPVLFGPLTIYTAAVDAAAPNLNVTPPSGTWNLLGASGNKSYAEDGVTVTPSQTIEETFVLGSTAPQKARRTQEMLSIAVTVYDARAELFAVAFNNATVTDTAAVSGVAGHRNFNLLQGSEVAEFALLLRGNQSPYGDDWVAQFWVPRAYKSDLGELTYTKGTPVGVAITFAALESTTSGNGFGKYYAQDANPA